MATAVISAYEGVSYGHNLWSGINVQLAPVGLLAGFAILNIIGIAEISVDSIASQSEFANLMQKLDVPVATQPPAPPIEKTLSEINAELIKRIRPVLGQVWPTQAPLKAFNLTLAGIGLTLNVHYESRQALNAIPLDMVTRELQERLQPPSLSLNAVRVSPVKKANSARE